MKVTEGPRNEKTPHLSLLIFKINMTCLCKKPSVNSVVVSCWFCRCFRAASSLRTATAMTRLLVMGTTTAADDDDSNAASTSHWVFTVAIVDLRSLSKLRFRRSHSGIPEQGFGPWMRNLVSRCQWRSGLSCRRCLVDVPAAGNA